MAELPETEQPKELSNQMPIAQEPDFSQRLAGARVFMKGTVPVSDETEPLPKEEDQGEPFVRSFEPEIEDPDDNGQPSFTESKDRQTRMARRERFENRQIEKKTDPREPDLSEVASPEDDEEGITARGAIEVFADIPRAVVGGVRNAVQEAIDLAPEIIEFLGDKGLFTEEEQEEFKEAKGKAPALPEVPEPRTTVGGITKGIVQFLTSFAGVGKVSKGAKILQKGGAITKSALQGTIADFVGGPEGTLSEVINKEFPEAKTPVTEFLGNPEDGELEKRAKRALEGAGLGVATDVTLKGIRALGRIKQSAKGKIKTEAAELRPKAEAKDFEALGDITEGAPLIEKIKVEKKIKKAIKETKGKAGEIQEKLKKGVDIPRETGPRGGGGRIKVGKDELFVNFARIDTSDDIKETIKVLGDSFKKEIDKATKKKVTFKEVELEADKVDAFESLFKKRDGQLPGKSEQLALRRLWAASGEKLTDLSKSIAAQKDPSDLEMFQFRKMLAIHHLIQKEVIGIRRETARALGQWRIPAGSAEAIARGVDDLLSANGGSDLGREMAKRLSVLADAGLDKEIEEVVRRGALARTGDAFLQAWINGLLSGPKTHIVNMMSNTAVVGLTMTERAGAARIAQLFGDKNSVAVGEATAQMFGVMQAMRENFRISWKGLKALGLAGKKATNLDAKGAKELITSNADEFGSVYKALATGQSGVGLGKIDLPTRGAFAEAAEISNDTWLGRSVEGISKVSRIDSNTIKSTVKGIGEKIDFTTTMPGRFLGAEDEVFKTIGYRMELWSRAHRQATKEVTDGLIKKADFKKRMADIVEDPPNDIRLDVVDAALYQTFTNRPGNFAQAIKQGVAKVPLLRVIVPFINTPANIFKFVHERTPWAPLFKTFRNDVAAGGAKRDIALARMGMGTSVMAIATDLALSTRLTGSGPKDPKERQALLRTGWKPYAVRIGGTDDDMSTGRYFAYNRFDPLGMTLGIGADLAQFALNNDMDDESVENYEEAVFVTIASVANNTMSKSYVRGAAELVEALSDPARKGERYFNRLATSLIPTGVKEVTRNVDPYLREASNLIESLLKGIPGQSEKLPLRLDKWGKPISFQSGLGGLYDVMSPSYSSKANPEPIDRELLRLGGFLNMPPSKITIEGVTVNLRKHPDIYQRYVELAGKDTKIMNLGAIDFFNKIVSGKHELSSVYFQKTDGPDGSKIDWLKDFDAKYKRKAKRQLMFEFSDVLQPIINKKRRELGRRPVNQFKFKSFQ